MSEWGIGIIVGLLVLTALAFVWVAVRLGAKKPQEVTSVSSGQATSTAPTGGKQAIEQAMTQDIDSIFDDEYREELRNRGRLYFEKIIGENAEFLQQDLRLTTSQINEFMKQEITKTLQEEFAKYEQAIEESKKIALESIQNVQSSLDEERQALRAKFQAEADAQREKVIQHFENNMGEIVNRYILDAIGSEMDLSSQLTYILAELQSNKEDILNDIRNGA
ncbi:hypothetical protein KC867_01835 [Candidatus Saccharibacteria bacterium]|nr:hypothetical protein [Candidatus Saccharibacteria bacterium]